MAALISVLTDVQSMEIRDAIGPHFNSSLYNSDVFVLKT
jgi:hypothetical protein